MPISIHNYLGTARLSQSEYAGNIGFFINFCDFPLLILYLLLFLKISTKKDFKIRFSNLDICKVGLIGMSFLTMYNASDRQLCLYQIFRLIIVYLVFFYMANAIKRNDLNLIIFALLTGLFLQIILGHIQYFSNKKLGL